MISDPNKEGWVLLGPAPDRMPAAEAVAIIEPPETGFVGPIFCIASEACLTARKTLWIVFNHQCVFHFCPTRVSIRQ